MSSLPSMLVDEYIIIISRVDPFDRYYFREAFECLVAVLYVYHRLAGFGVFADAI